MPSSWFELNESEAKELAITLKDMSCEELLLLINNNKTQVKVENNPTVFKTSKRPNRSDQTKR